MRFLPFLILLALGLGAGYFLAPFEAAAAENHLLGFPNANANLHRLRPFAVYGFCLVPALGALWYSLTTILDRYLFQRALSAFLLVTSAFLLLFVLLDLQDSLSELSAGFQSFEKPFRFLGTYYVVLLSQTFTLLLPFTILLALLYSLGQLSASREIIAFTQTGRGIFRLLGPLITLGGLLSLSSFFLGFHLAPWAEGYRDALLDSAKRKADMIKAEAQLAESPSGEKAVITRDLEEASQATNVIYRNEEMNRVWFIERFPYDLAGASPLLDLRITTRNPDGSLHDILTVPEASWDRESGDWRFSRPSRLIAQSEPTPTYEPNMPNPLVVQDWPETPSQLIQGGLDPRYLGIPALTDWLKQKETEPAHVTERDLTPAFQTQLQYRWAQPLLCLVAVLLAAPLGISFSRRGRGGTAAVAITLSALMLFSAEMFLAFGDSGSLPAVTAAWATNAIFLLIALILIQRRLTGRPIFQTLRKCVGG